MVANVPSPVLKFDTDFDFDSSNAQFIKEELERGGQDKRKVKGWFVTRHTTAIFAFYNKQSSLLCV